MNPTYSQAEHATWFSLITKRQKFLQNQACSLYIEGLKKLQLPVSYVPTTHEMNQLIEPLTGWRMIPTTKLVLARDYFKMLSNRLFPVITTMRSHDEINYYASPKPDVIHEYFGHGPFLTNPDFTNFMQRLAQIATSYERHEQILLGRLFWFTIEFGLLNTAEGLRAYGAGIIPSEAETKNALYSNEPERREFNILDILRTPFSAIAKQTIYYVIPNFDNLYSLLDVDLGELVLEACKRGSFSKSQKIS